MIELIASPSQQLDVEACIASVLAVPRGHRQPVGGPRINTARSSDELLAYLTAALGRDQLDDAVPAADHVEDVEAARLE